MNNLQVARLLFTSPTQAFTALKEKSVFALPMFLTLVFGAAVIAAYYSKIDIAWFNDQVLAPAARKMTAEQQQMMAARMTRSVLLWSSTISAPIVTLILMVVGAAYFLIVGNLTNIRYSFNQWFAFNWWAASPQIIGSVASLLILTLSSSTQIGTSAMQPLSLNELVFHKTMSEPGYALLSALGLVQVAAAWLTYVGIKAWSGRSTTFCLVFALLPSVLVYGIWAFFSFR